MNLPTLEDIQKAQRRLEGQLHRTPIMLSSTLDEMTGVKLFLKAESFQKTGSFKARGALNALLNLSEEQRQKGVIAVSAGNHASGVAWASRKTNTKATVVMPATASQNKIAAVRSYGAEIVLSGSSTIEAFAHMERLRAERGLTLVHPFDGVNIISGAGTLGLELLEQVDGLENIVVPVGGGGLISGIAIGVKTVLPKIKVLGVEPWGANAMYRSLEAKCPVSLEKIDTIADGLSAPMTSELTYEAVSKYVDEVVCVSDEEIRKAMRLLLERCKLVVEPSGAAGLAALLAHRLPCKPGSNTAVVLSGGNVDLSMIASLQDVV